MVQSSAIQYCCFLFQSQPFFVSCPIGTHDIFYVIFTNTLRLVVYRQSVHLAAKPLEAHDQIFYFAKHFPNVGHISSPVIRLIP
jgi:hypothetical protein